MISITITTSKIKTQQEIYKKNRETYHAC